MKPSRPELSQLLEAAGTTPTPPPDPTFVDNLETRLLDGSLLPDGSLTAGRDTRPAGVRSRALRFVAAAAVALVVVVGIGALAGWFAGDAHDVRLRLASDTTVVLPNGHSVTGRAGLSLEDGTVVRVGPRGHAAIGSVEIGPGEEAVVADGRVHLRTDHTRPAPPTDSRTITTLAAPVPESTVLPPSTRGPTPTRAPPSTTSSVPTTTRVVAPTTTTNRAATRTTTSR